MKKIYVLWSLAIATLFANVFFACKSDDTLEDFYRRQDFTMQLVKTPDFVVYSDGNVLASTLSTTTRAETRGEGDIVEPVEGVDYFLVEAYDYRGSINGIWHTTGYKEIPDVYAPYAANAPLKSNDGKSGVEGVSGAEYAYVMKYIKEHPEEAKDKCTVEKDYFVQNVGSSDTKYDFQIPNWNHTGYRTETYIGGNVMNYLYFDNIHIAGESHPYTSHQGHRILCLYDKIPLTEPIYKAVYGDLVNWNYDAFTYYYIEYPEGSGKTSCYLCFDYRMSKTDDAGDPFVYNGDGVYDDWVIKITHADGTDIKKPGPDPDPTPDPDPVITDEVEINLSVNDKKEKDDYIATKLSIHIRALTDVEVFIPVTQEYYCDADDMAIVLSHKMDPNYQYSNPDQAEITNGYTYSYTIAGKTLTVTVTYEADGIRVKTDGLTQEVLDYLQETYQDGFTVEVWNYFNDAIPQTEGSTIVRKPIDRTGLKPMLDNSTVTFTSTEHPAYYVNAFAMLYNYQKDGLYVYMKDNKPYIYDVKETYNSETGKFDGRTLTPFDPEKPLGSAYWVANDDGTFKEFVGDKNAWDCTVTPPAAYTVETTHTGTTPADFNVIYKK